MKKILVALMILFTATIFIGGCSNQDKVEKAIKEYVEYTIDLCELVLYQEDEQISKVVKDLDEKTQIIMDLYQDINDSKEQQIVGELVKASSTIDTYITDAVYNGRGDGRLIDNVINQTYAAAKYYKECYNEESEILNQVIDTLEATRDYGLFDI